MTPEAIEELRRLEKAATPGTVLIERREDDDGSIDWIVYSPNGDFAACFETANENARANAHFLAALRNAFPVLLDAATLLESERAIRLALEDALGKAERELADLLAGKPLSAEMCKWALEEPMGFAIVHQVHARKQVVEWLQRNGHGGAAKAYRDATAFFDENLGAVEGDGHGG